MNKQNQLNTVSPRLETSASTSQTDSFKAPQAHEHKPSSSDQSLICSNKPLTKSENQHQLDLKYNEYLRPKLMRRLLKSKMIENKDLLDRQTIQLAMMIKELTDLKCQFEIQNKNNSYSKTIKLKMNENLQLTDKLLKNLRKNCTSYKEMLKYFTIISSQMPINNVDLTGCDNEMLYKSLENVNGLLKSISDSFVTHQINHLKDIFDNIEVKNSQLCRLYKECLEQLNIAASNVIINATNQLNIENTDDTM